MGTPFATIALLPGLDGAAALFAPLEGALAGRALPLPVAYPSDRLLDYAALEVLVRAALAEAGPCWVVAESFSGPIAIRLAAQPPPGLQGVLLVASFATRPAPVPSWLAAPLLPVLARLPTPTRAATWALLGDDPPTSLVQSLLAAIAQVSPPVRAQRIRAVLAVDVTEPLACAQVPMGYLGARQDRVVPARCGDHIARLAPGLVHSTLDGPHLLLQRHPAPSAARILAFIEGARPRQQGW